MKKSKSKKKLIKTLESLSYDELVSVVDWSKVVKCLANIEDSDAKVTPMSINDMREAMTKAKIIKTPNTMFDYIRDTEDLWKDF